jgi:hypothetical protein
MTGAQGYRRVRRRFAAERVGKLAALILGRSRSGEWGCTGDMRKREIIFHILKTNEVKVSKKEQIFAVF